MKYNYDNAVKVVRDNYETTKKVTYEELETTLELPCPITEHPSSSSIIQSLKGRLKKHGITIKSANSAKIKSLWYDILPLEEAEAKEKKKEAADDIKTALQALEKDNQKLYLQNEELQKECDELRARCERFAVKEAEYKSVISLFYKMAMGEE